MKKSLFLLFIVCLQIALISFLGYKIYLQKGVILGKQTRVNHLKKENLIFSPTNTSLYFYEPKPNTVDYPDTRLNLATSYTINSDSLNERFDYSIEKPENVFRIVTLGDSFTFGVGVNTRDNYSEKLEDLLNTNLHCKRISQFEVINLGVGGYDFEYAIRRYQKRGMKYSPNLITWFLIDFHRIDEETIPLYYNLLEEAKSSGEYYKYIEQKKYYEPFNSAVKKVEEHLGKENIIKYQKNALLQIFDFYKQEVVFLVPPWIEGEKEMKKFLLNLTTLQPNALTFFLDPVFYEINNRLIDGHPNEKGHKIIAEQIFNYLTKNKIIPCN